MEIKISLIVSTYGRYDEVDLLLESFTKQDANLATFEVLIIDQNDLLDLSPIVSKYNNILNITHYKAAFKGLSKAKNKGIELARGEILTFPDDDCTFYPNTISTAVEFLAKNLDVDVVYGKVFDRSRNANVMRNWPNKQNKLNLFNFTFNYSAITCFTKLKILFDERYGVGSAIALGEETDYVIRAINHGYNVVYTPSIQVWHPELNVLSMTPKKVYDYAYGYGSIMRKNFSAIIFLIFFLSLFYQIIRFLANVFTKDSSKYSLAFKGRINGFLAPKIKH